MNRDQRIRNRLFPGVVPFEPTKGGYTALPFLLRRVQWLFDAREWQIYTYILMRLGPSGVGWLTLAEMSWDLDFRSLPKLRAYIDKLVDAGWLLHQTSRARDYFMAPNPISVIEKLASAGKLPADRIEAIDELLESLKWPLLAKGNVIEEDELDELLNESPTAVTAAKRAG